MKKIFLLLILAQPFLLQAQLEKTLKKTIELKMPGKLYTSIVTGLDSLPGTRGASVAWHPIQKKYYASFAGNATYPMAVFDITGMRLSGVDLTCMEDTRGLWYDPKLEKICGNAYNNTGWFNYTLDSRGIPQEAEIFAAGMNQPGAQSLGVINPKSNNIYFIYGQEIYVYNTDAMEEEDSTIRLYPGISRKEDIDEEDDSEVINEEYSGHVVIFTGISKAEFGLLNVLEKQVELYNRKTGLLTQILKLPSDLKTWPIFNFSYTNGIYWIFNQDTRVWEGYK